MREEEEGEVRRQRRLSWLPIRSPGTMEQNTAVCGGERARRMAGKSGTAVTKGGRRKKSSGLRTLRELL